jgi:coenzyme F420-dependent oxidoreductase
MKIGIVAPYWNDITKKELQAIARLAEELGYHSIWVPEMWGRDAFSVLSVLALSTERIKLGTGVISVFSRTPATIAQTIATLDEISNGRMILGLGTSGPAVIENWHGLKFEKPLQRTREYVEIIRMILRGERVNYSGDIFKLKGFRLQFTPPRKEIPIYIASLGPKNLRLTGEVADGWIPFLIPRSGFKDAVREIASGAEAVGRRFEEITVSPYIPVCISRKDEETSKKIVKEHIAYYIGSMGTFYYKTLCRYGFKKEADSILEAWKQANKTQAIMSVTDTLLNSVAIAGSPKEGREGIEELKREGIDLPILIFPPKASREMVRETLVSIALECLLT